MAALETSLSPRLRHLLIQEDRRTGQLFMPFNQNNVLGNRPLPVHSPAHSPAGALPSPTDTRSALPAPADGKVRLPPPNSLALGPRPVGDRSASVFSLLNDRVGSPPSTASSDGSVSLHPDHSYLLRPGSSRRPGSSDMQPLSPLSIPHNGPPLGQPFSAPLPPPHAYPHTSFIAPEPRRSVTHAPSHYPPRPDLGRRHSSHPYEYNPASRPQSALSSRDSYSSPYSQNPIIGARTPISRTTKACNACRSRKVRCDAGGLGNGETGTCSRCRESGVECVYTGVQKKRGPCPGTVRSRRPSSSHNRSSAGSAYPLTPDEDYSRPWSSSSSFNQPAPHHYPPPHAHLQGPPPPASYFPDPAQWSSTVPRPLTASNKQPMPVQQAPPPHVTDMSRAPPYVDPRWAHGPPTSVPVHAQVQGWEPAQVDIRMSEPGMFEKDYTMRSNYPESAPSSRPTTKDGSKLPPLRVAIKRSDSYYKP